MASAIFDKRFDSSEVEGTDFVFQHDDGREWTPEEIRLVNEAVGEANATVRRFLDHLDADLAVQRDTLRHLKSCVVLLESSNQKATVQNKVTHEYF